MKREKIREVALIAGVLLFFGAYRALPPLARMVDLVVTPAVTGITVAYGSVSTWIHRWSGLNLGFVQDPRDPEFLFSVQLATCINERRAGPLIDIATNVRLPDDKRERALRALLNFPSTDDWVQPFLNELPKGGMYGLYKESTPILDELIKKIRAGGGLRQPLVRAYAEVVFSFMMQVPDAVLRGHAVRWVSDVLAEDAIFMIIPRLEKERDPKLQSAIETALLEIRAVSDPESARSALLPYYMKPTWPSLRFPLAIVLSRLGHPSAPEVLTYALRREQLTDAQKLATRVALAGTRYPRELKMSESEKKLLDQRASERKQQVQLAMEKRERILRQERMRRTMLARAKPEVVPPTPQTVVEPVRTEETTAPPEVPETKEPEQRPQEAPVVTSRPQTPPPAQVPAPVERPKPVAEEEPAVAAPVDRKAPPKTFDIPGELTPEERASTPGTPTQVARLPETVLPPPLEEPQKQPRSLMNYVDVVFEVKKDAPVFQNPGDKRASNVTLPAGTKGVADFEMMVGDERWLQVKTKKGNGWVEAGHLQAFNLSPDDFVPAASLPGAQPPSEDNLDGDRKESTYFEPTTEDVSVHAKPSAKSDVVGQLKMGTVYLAVKSEKVGQNRWFLLQLTSDQSGWVLGDINLQLANVAKPSDIQKSAKPLSQRGEKRAFTAEWIVPTVKGVGVYRRTSLGSGMIGTIDPGKVYRVVEASEGGGSEWYRIESAGKPWGWVQSMDVKLTKAPGN